MNNAELLNEFKYEIPKKNNDDSYLKMDYNILFF